MDAQRPRVDSMGGVAGGVRVGIPPDESGRCWGHGTARTTTSIVFVPLFSLCLLWLRRDLADALPRRGSWGEWPALAAGVVALLMLPPHVDSLGSVSSTIPATIILFPLLIGLTLWLGGWRGLLWAWPSIAFLVFMVPLPGFLAVMLSHPLQRIATTPGVCVDSNPGHSGVARGT